jgi:2-methoxy-6-polyprenyl-1,4-benzoquinol methylase
VLGVQQSETSTSELVRMPLLFVPSLLIFILLCRLYDQYSFSVIPLLGTILAGDRASYQYLVESIRRFPPQEDFANMIGDAGFATNGERPWTDLCGGIACIHTGVKV